MKTLQKNVLIALAVLGMGTTAVAVQAQNTAPQARHERTAATPQERMARMSEHFAKRQAKLHDALQLSGGQESAWAAYQASIKPNGAMMAAMGDRAAWASMSAPARMEKMIAMAKQHTATMESQLGALNTFYSTLNPAQKKIFDEQTRGGRGHHGHRMGGMKG
jgi:protein CpxP